MNSSLKIPKILALLVITGMILSFVMPASVQAATSTATFNPVADAAVYQSTPTTNFGSLTTLKVDSSPIIRSYLRFTVTGMTGKTVSSVQLKMYANTALSAGFSVDKESNNTWTESGITYNNAPAPGAVIKSSGAVTAASWATVDISSYVKGDGTYNLVLAPLSSTALSFASRQSGANAPKLVITYSGTGTQATATPTAKSPTKTPTAKPPAATPTVKPPAASPTPTKITSSGDPVLVGAGDIAICSLTGRTETAALLAKTPFTAIFTAGDNSNESGTMAQYTGCFGPTWGQYMKYIHPTAGNHDASGYPNYYTYFGAAAGPAGKGWYSYDLGTWHIIMLNTGCTGMVGPCNDSAGSAQELWLKADLAAHTNKCTMAIMHQPRFSSGYHGSAAAQQPLWQDLYNAGADVVVDGHDHDYERFAAQDPTGKADASKGIREFVVGTGGAEHRDFNAPIANSQVRIANVWGIMKFTLHPTSYDWQFIPVAGQTATDSGSASCH
ncbi:MAG: DNRLRE domain-containing protein [Anaerolineaceae bacterium]|nr:DNRLRE domain-containing protein [Anaerolineaceae bacterium]